MTTITDLSHWDKDPRIFLFTSLTAGSSHIVTATSRIETILRANKIPFEAIDVATDETAKKLWGRRAGKKKLPGLVKEGYVIADLEEVEDWNEFDELKENIGPLPPTIAPGAKPDPTVHTVQNTLGSLRMHDAASASQSAKPNPAPAQAPRPTAAPVSQGVATPLVPLVNASKANPPSTNAAPTSTVASTPSSLTASDSAKPETISSSVNDKKESIQAAEEKTTLSSSSCTSAEAETISTTTATATEPPKASSTSDNTADPIGAAAKDISADPVSVSSQAASGDKSLGERKHRGSSVSVASPEEIKEVEEKTAIAEEEEDEDEEEAAAAADGEQASVSVKD